MIWIDTGVLYLPQPLWAGIPNVRGGDLGYVLVRVVQLPMEVPGNPVKLDLLKGTPNEESM